MIRQLGVPTLFMTFSAAESKWLDLLVILKKIVDNEEVSSEHAGNMNYNERARLIRSDPVTCARYFENRFRHFLHLVILNPDGPFKNHPVEDYYIRFEFQHRGSVHAHMVLWLKDGPVYQPGNSESISKCRKLIDSLISCSADDTLGDVLSYQRHKHSFTCRKSSQVKCRFGIPFLPMKRTNILEPLEVPQGEYRRNKLICNKLRQDLNSDSDIKDIDNLLELN